MEGYFYNSGFTLKEKIALSVSAGIGGVMIWEVGQDVQPFNRSDSLMSAVYEGLLHSERVSLPANEDEL